MAFNMDPKKCPMPTQDPNVRNKNFEEVALGYTEEMAVNEAKRCIHCKNKPCQTGCPVGIDIPEFIGHVAEGDFEAAYQVIARSSSLPAVCGRVCPQESQCEGKCTRGIKNEPVGIGRLERFVADWHRENVHTAPIVPAWNGHKVAIIGAGPAGLTAAGDLAKLGYKVTVYEALHVAGGVLMYGIPEFRLPKAIVQQEIDGLKKMGVDFECNMVIGKVLTIDELMNDFREQIATANPPQVLERAEQFIGDHPESVVSNYLLRRYFISGATPDYAKALQLCRTMRKAQPKNALLAHYEQQLKQLSRVTVGKRLPRFSTVDVDNKKIDNATLGKGLAVIMAYATWSYDAQRMLQDMRTLAKSSKGKLKIIGFCVDPNRNQCRAIAKRDSIPWPVICDGKMPESPTLHSLSLFDIPDNILVNNGVVIAKGLTNDELKQRIERML